MREKLFTLLLLISINIHAQNQWVFLNGNPEQAFGSYIAPNIPDIKNVPSVRKWSTTFQAGNKLYILGGSNSNNDRNNDLWSYDTTTKAWLLVKGGQYPTPAVYGTKSISSPSNQPPDKNCMASWSMGNKLYFFGGSTTGYYNDIWVYDTLTNQYTWIKGSNTGIATTGVYGSIGIPDSNNNPQGRTWHYSFTHGGYLYMYGGYANGIGYGWKNDLWRYDTSTNYWTWIKGSVGYNDTGSYGTQGVSLSSNLPPSYKYFASSWYCNGKFYLFSGGDRDDMWEYDVSTNGWKWIKGSNVINQPAVYGIKGVAASNNTPGIRSKAANWVYNNKLYLYSGNASNELWEFDPSTNNWKWVSGDTSHAACNFGTKYKPDQNNNPGKRLNAQVWQSGNKVYLFGGETCLYDQLTTISTNDLWVLDIITNSWIWVNGSENPYNTSILSYKNAITKNNNPAGREHANSWFYDSVVYVYGGISTYSLKYDPDVLWQYNIVKNEWKWVSGFLNQLPSYGLLNSPSVYYSPGDRNSGCTWKYNNKLYLFGGETKDGLQTPHFCNDIWVYDLSTNLWTWIKGNDTFNSKGVYGTKGVSASTNTPSSRKGAAYWQYNNKFYMFGGMGIDSTGSTGELNDLWEYDAISNNWKWIKGDKQSLKNGVYYGSASNLKPGSRYGSSSFTYNGKLYLFGGIGLGITYPDDRRLNDLWAYDTLSGNWTWLKGSTATDAAATFGTIGIPSSVNTPGAKINANVWTIDNSIYLYGGDGILTSNNSGGLSSDLWKYDPISNNWTWISGSTIAGTHGIYTSQGIANGNNTPGGRSASVTWSGNNKLYILGGYTITSNNYAALAYRLNDIWYYDVCQSSTCIPVPQLSLPDTLYICGNQNTTINAGNIGCRYLWNTGDTSQTISTNSPGTYWVIITNTNNISITDSVKLVATTLPVVNIGNDTSVCSNQQIQLSAGTSISGLKYYWNTGDTSQTIIPNKAQMYYVNVYTNTGCINSDTMNLYTLPVTIFSLGPDKNICTGDSISLSPVQTLSSVRYHWNTGDTTKTIKTTSAGVYTLSITNDFGCTTADTISTAVLPIPYVNLGVDTNICYGDSIILNSGYNSTIWNSSLTGAMIIARDTGTYIAVVTGTNSCKNTDTIHIGAILSPGADSIVYISNDPTYSFTLINPTNINSYFWDFGDGDTSSLQTPQHSYKSNGNYNLKVYLYNLCDTVVLNKKVSVFNSGLTNLLANQGFKYYPNPSNGLIIIESTTREPIDNIEVYNSIGQKIQYSTILRYPNKIIINLLNAKTDYALLIVYTKDYNAHSIIMLNMH